MSLLDDALEHFSHGLHNQEFEHPISKYVALALAALEKRKAAMVVHERTFWTYRHRCPSCRILLEKEGIAYCSHCGQHLDWSAYEARG